MEGQKRNDQNFFFSAGLTALSKLHLNLTYLIPLSIGLYGIALGHAAACPYKCHPFYFKLLSYHFQLSRSVIINGDYPNIKISIPPV
jgi:hypothetical protein